jgi:hypothetical protein
MKYQLVLQVLVSSIKDYDMMIWFEDEIVSALGDVGDVDGHDAGTGEMNIFIYTDEPKIAFERITGIIGVDILLPHLKAAYRKIDSNDFTIIYPSNLKHFAVT